VSPSSRPRENGGERHKRGVDQLRNEKAPPCVIRKLTNGQVWKKIGIRSKFLYSKQKASSRKKKLQKLRGEEVSTRRCTHCMRRIPWLAGQGHIKNSGLGGGESSKSPASVEHIAQANPSRSGWIATWALMDMGDSLGIGPCWGE